MVRSTVGRRYLITDEESADGEDLVHDVMNTHFEK
jgi:hypothetical protein